jgi:hypothetical protein
MRRQYDVRPEQRDNYFVRTYPQVRPARCALHTLHTLHAARCTLHAARCTLHTLPPGTAGASSGTVAAGSSLGRSCRVPTLPPPAFAALPAFQDPEKIEMSFNLSTYQPHLKDAGMDVYQTYYLDAQVGLLGRGCEGWWRRVGMDRQATCCWLEHCRLRAGTGLAALVIDTGQRRAGVSCQVPARLTPALACLLARPHAAQAPVDGRAGGAGQGAGQPLDEAVCAHLDPLCLLGALGGSPGAAARSSSCWQLQLPWHGFSPAAGTAHCLLLGGSSCKPLLVARGHLPGSGAAQQQVGPRASSPAPLHRLHPLRCVSSRAGATRCTPAPTRSSTPR